MLMTKSIKRSIRESTTVSNTYIKIHDYIMNNRIENPENKENRRVMFQR